MIYFTIKKFKKLRPSRTSLVMLCFLLVFSCKNKGNGNGDDTPTVKHTLTITKPTGGTLSSGPAGIDCGSKGTTCKAEFSKGTEVTLTAKGFSSGPTDLGHAPAAWQGACAKTAADQPCKLSMDANKAAGKLFTDIDVDDDNDGLIDIHNLDMFNHIQYNLAGTSYKTAADAQDNRKGAPGAETDDCTRATMDGDKEVYLCGYELMRDLDFADGASYASGSVNTDWRPDDEDTDSATNAGFVGADDFTGIFEGNEHSISHLYSRGIDNRGLFRKTTNKATIRNLGVVDARLYSSSVSKTTAGIVGALVGENRGNILASYATGGNLNNGTGNDHIGGLVGENRGSILASYATGGNLNSDTGNDRVGGLVGNNRGGSILASYVRGSTISSSKYAGGLVGVNQNGGSISASSATDSTINSGTEISYTGGLVGTMASGTNSITASFAVVAANGGGGNDHIGGLVGDMGSSSGGTNTITASYATGAANGGTGDDKVGGLVGTMGSGINTITACYATGTPDGGANADTVGALVGNVNVDDRSTTNAIVHSYAFGTPTGGVGTPGHPGTNKPMSVTRADGLTADNVDSKWNDASEKTKSAWVFATGKPKPPALKYADYDGAGSSSVDYCTMFLSVGDIICGTTLLPDQPGR